MSGFFITPQTIVGSGSSPIGPAGGELSGNYPNPDVITINGASVPDSGDIPAGNFLQIISDDVLGYAPLNLAGGNNYITGTLPSGNLPSATTSNLGIVKLAGDLGGSGSVPSVLKVNGTTFPAGGSLTTGNGLYVSGSGAVTYSPLNLAGGSNYISGSLPAANQVSQNLGGDISGTTASGTVIKINGISVAATPSANQLLIASSSSASGWSLLGDSNVSASAAIVSTKLAYSDVSSPSLGSSTVQGALDAIKTQAVATAIQRLSQTISTANLQAAGALLTANFNIGSALPANTRVLGVEVNVTQILAGIALSAALITVQGSGDIAGSLIASASLLSTGLYGGTGTNQYLSRGGQQIIATIILTGPVFSALTGGALTVNVFYSVVS